MKRPEDIPVWAWALSQSVFDKVYDEEPDLEGGCEEGIVEAYARAIVTSVMVEREACAQMADGVREKSNHPAWGATYDMTPAQIATAIRNRSQP